MTWIFNNTAVTNSRLTYVLQCIFFKCILWDTPISTANNWYKYYNRQVNILHFSLYMLHIKVTHGIYLFMMCLFIYLLYLPHLLCVFICLFVFSSGLLHNSLHNSPEVCSSNLLHSGCLKSCEVCVYKYTYLLPHNTPFYVTVILASCKESSTMDNMKTN